MEVKSVFTIKTKDGEDRKKINRVGQEAVNFIRANYPKGSVIILEGFEINNKFVAL